MIVLGIETSCDETGVGIVRTDGTNVTLLANEVASSVEEPARFGAKARMLSPDEVLVLTGHPVGGVCPFGLATPLPVHCDLSLRDFAQVLPAAGSLQSAVQIAPERIAALTGAAWVDVCQPPA